MKNFKDEFIQNMKYYREVNKVSQAKLAELCDCGTGTIGFIESGRQFPSFDLLFRISEVLNVHPADLFLRDASKTKQQLGKLLKEELFAQINNFIEKYYLE